MDAFTVPLSALDHSSLAVAGGKAANLGELLRAGFPVPAGFCVTTHAYRRFVDDAGMGPRILATLAGLQPEDTAALATAGQRVRDLVLGAAMPGTVADAIREAAAAYAGQPLAVRSSATAEDLPEASFAGQQDTFLGVLGEEALLDAVRRCWASLWTDRAIAYRQRNGIPHASVALAVVVQEMVPAEAAGVLFTANPVSGKRSEAVVDASFGLGEAVVSGAVSPDNFVVDKRSLSLVSRTIGSKQVQVVATGEGGTTTVAVEPAAAARQALADEQLRELVRLGTAIESHFGWPQDVEWALAEGKIHILQSRPITSLYGLPPQPSDGLPHVYVSINSMQGMLEPLTPLGASLFVDLSRYGFVGGDERRAFLHELNNRLYADVTTVMRGPLAPYAVRLVLPEVEPVVGRILRRMLAAGSFDQPPALKPTDVIGFIWRFRRNLVPMLARIPRSVLFPTWARRRLRTHLVPRLRAIRAEMTGPSRLGDQVASIYRAFDLIVKYAIAFQLVPLVAAGVASFKRAEVIVREEGLDERTLARVRQGLPHNITTLMDLELWALAKQVKADPASRAALTTGAESDVTARYRKGGLPKPLQLGMERFLRRFGHRAVREIDLGIPRWAEDPTYLFGVLRNYIAMEDPETAPDVHFARLKANAERSVAELAAAAGQLPHGGRKAAMLRFLLGRFRQLGGLREAPKFYIMWLFQGMRVKMLEAGAQLTAAGRLDRAEDVFFLRLAELAQAGKQDMPYQALVAERRRAYEREFARTRIPLVLTSEGETFYGEALTSGDGALAGTGASPGVARGKARVIRNPLGARLEPGEILVTPSTDPAWTPLFLTAGALVMEAGGMMSHGSIVAREYGIPAVVGVAEATSRLHDGQQVEVDGFAGVVRVVTE